MSNTEREELKIGIAKALHGKPDPAVLFEYKTYDEFWENMATSPAVERLTVYVEDQKRSAVLHFIGLTEEELLHHMKVTTVENLKPFENGKYVKLKNLFAYFNKHKSKHRQGELTNEPTI